ncbi:hypothetical protein NLJ89_g3550 [Agrocybe chaxingu]|uniref:DUF6534 domain-containing protein n=1 Tax=Agrocybe chaxingu TaxID=84603 RepID=A0A9W8K4L9_9AGAR|nr:hypothetical protein NLJ89_g3550 [Agrocybe chaxingu]
MSFISPISMKGPAEFAHGWMLIGCAVNILLLGVSIAQVYMYYVKYKEDRTWIKLLVAGVLLLNVVNTVLLFTYIYRSLITFFGDNAALGIGDWILATGAWTTGVIACSVQLFFAWRILVLTKNWIFVVVIGCLAIAGGSAGIATAAQTGKALPFSEFLNFKTTVIIWLAAEVASDVLITTHKHKTGFKRSDMMVDRIIRVTLQTGLLTMVIATLDIIFFLVDPSGTHFLFNFPLAKLYANSLMSSLNSRRGWKFNGTSSGSASESQGNTTSSGVQRHRHISAVKKPTEMIDHDASRAHPGVFVHVESHEMRDVQVRESFDTKPRTLRLDGSIDAEKWGAADKNGWAR